MNALTTPFRISQGDVDDFQRDSRPSSLEVFTQWNDKFDPNNLDDTLLPEQFGRALYPGQSFIGYAKKNNGVPPVGIELSRKHNVAIIPIYAIYNDSTDQAGIDNVPFCAFINFTPHTPENNIDFAPG